MDETYSYFILVGLWLAAHKAPLQNITLIQNDPQKETECTILCAYVEMLHTLSLQGIPGFFQEGVAFW